MTFEYEELGKLLSENTTPKEVIKEDERMIRKYCVQKDTMVVTLCLL